MVDLRLRLRLRRTPPRSDIDPEVGKAASSPLIPPDQQTLNGFHRRIKSPRRSLYSSFLGGGLIIFAFYVGAWTERRAIQSGTDFLSNEGAWSCHIPFMMNAYDEDGPPSDLVVHGKRKFYEPVPETSRRLFYAEGKGEKTIIRAFRNQGWRLVDTVKDAHLVYRTKGSSTKIFPTLKPWQRFAKVMGSAYWDDKDTFFVGFERYHQQNPDHDLYFLPETYRLEEEAGRQAFHQRLTSGGSDEPWLLKKVDVNNGRGIEVLAPRSEALDSAIEHSLKDKKNDYIVQSYICDELTWVGGNKFDLRMYWAVASVDPPIVLYHDGFVRVGAAAYNESDFSDTTKHLTNHDFQTEEQSEVTADHLYERIREHYEANYVRLSPGMKDPVQHVRKQMKEAIGTLYAAFRGVFGFGPEHSPKDSGPENLFGVYGADFVIDKDLDVHFLEAQAGPGFGERYDYKIELFRDIYRPVPAIVEEIALKQQANASGNILPLTTLGGYEIVFAGDWQYKYKNYKRAATKKKCVV